MLRTAIDSRGARTTLQNNRMRSVDLTLEPGACRVVRNGHLPTRAIPTPLGDVRVQHDPGSRDRRPVSENPAGCCGRRSQRVNLRLVSTSLARYVVASMALSQAHQHVGVRPARQLVRRSRAPDAAAPCRRRRARDSRRQEEQDPPRRSRIRPSLRLCAMPMFGRDEVSFNVRLEDTDNKRQCIPEADGRHAGGAEGADRRSRGVAHARSHDADRGTRCMLVVRAARAHDRPGTRPSATRTSEDSAPLSRKAFTGDPRTAVIRPTSHDERAEQAAEWRPFQGEGDA